MLWEYQSRDRLGLGSGGTKEFMMLHHDGDSLFGSVSPERAITDNPAPVAGSEILITAIAQAEITITATLFNMTPTGTGSAPGRLRSIRSYFNRDSVGEVLQAAGVVVVDLGPVKPRAGLLETEFESRAEFDLRVRFVDVDTEAATYIEKAEWVGTLI